MKQAKKNMPMTDEDRFADWRRYIHAVRDETVQVFWNRKLFRSIHRMFQTNPNLQSEGAHVWVWIAHMYMVDASMLVRRELDKQSKVLNLRHLLYDIEDHVEILKAHGQHTDLPTAQEVHRHRQELETKTRAVRDYAERFLAHRTGTVLKSPVTLADVDRAIREVLSTMRRYYRYITGKGLISGTPIPQGFNILAPFYLPWITDSFAEPSDEEELEADQEIEALPFAHFLNDPEWQRDPETKARTEAGKAIEELLKKRRDRIPPEQNHK